MGLENGLFLGSIHLSPRWGFRWCNSWGLYTFRPDGAKEGVEGVFLYTFRPDGAKEGVEGVFLYTFRPDGVLDGVILGVYTPFAPMGF